MSLNEKDFFKLRIGFTDSNYVIQQVTRINADLLADLHLFQ